jgi:hypothetical protein
MGTGEKRGSSYNSGAVPELAQIIILI